jgi:hypothetical protein
MVVRAAVSAVCLPISSEGSFARQQLKRAQHELAGHGSLKSAIFSLIVALMVDYPEAMDVDEGQGPVV